MSTLDSRLAGLTPAQRQLLAQRLARPGGGIQPVPRDGPLPLSFAQQRLWFVQQLDPTSAAYNAPLPLRLRGPIDVELLRRSLVELVARHEPLRTSFPVDPRTGTPVQRIHTAAPTLQGIPAGGLRAFAALPFDLANGPLFRAGLLRHGPDDHHLLLVTHHSVSDGWSDAVMLRDLGEIYTARLRGRAPALPALPIQYADHAAWQRGRGAQLDAELAHWVARIGDAPRVLDLTPDRPRPRVPRGRGAFHPIALPAAPLRDLARRGGTTPFAVTLAAYAILLGRHARQDEVLIGTVVAGRGASALDDLLGCFVNALPLRVDLRGDPRFGALLERVRATLADAFAHAELPFERLVEGLGVERSLERQPLVQTMLGFQPWGRLALRLGDVEAEVEPLSLGTSRYDLLVSFQEEGARYAGTIEYDADLFDADTVARMAGQLARLVEASAAGPDRRIADLPWLAPAEAERLHVLGGAGVSTPTPPSFLACFAAQVAARPDAEALRHAGGSISYRKLDAESDALAAALRVQPGAVVGVALPRGPALIRTFLAVLKAGATWLPLDPAHPPERLAMLVADAGAACVVSEALPFVEDVAVERLSVHPESAAYVIYTSGSTGRPKGVVVPHRGLAHLTAALGRDFRTGPGDRILQFASPVFDASILEIALSLAHGAALVCAAPSEMAPGEALVGVLRRERVTHALLPPIALTVTASEGLPHLRVLLVGGDVCTREMVARWSAPGRRLVNAYGPTEVSVASTWGELAPERRAPSIGRAIPGTRIRIVDARGRPVPVGVPGEIHIGGPGVASGYLGRPGLTASVFVPDPLEPGARCYATGDLGRFLPDGRLEFLGRKDAQLKIRGVRVEPGEVEAALTRHPSVRAACVVARGVGEAHQQLIAYVEGDEAPDLWDVLRRTLPEALVPADIVWLPTLPLTPSGKVDRRALPALRERRATVGEPPRSPTERTLAAIWAEVLGREAVGLHENFFALGGDSILSIQVVSRAAAAGLRLTPKDLFERQTVATLAAVADAARPAAIAGLEPEVPTCLTPIQRWFLGRPGVPPRHWNLETVVHLEEDVPEARVMAALAAVVAHHDALRTRFVRTERGWEARAGTGLDVIHAPDAATLHASFDLETGPLVGAVIRPRQVLIAAHHLVMDVVSLQILREDLVAALRGDPLPRSTSFAHWARRVREAADEAERPFWRAQVAPPLFVGAPGREGDAVVHTHVLDPDTTAALFNAATLWQAQPLELLVAGLAAAVGRAFALDLEGHGREALFPDVDLTRTIGWFTSVWPVRIDAPDAGWDRLVPAVKATLRAVPRRGIGFGLLDTDTPPPSLSLNWLGRLQPGQGSGVPTRDPAAIRVHPVEFDAWVDAGRLHLVCAADPEHDEPTRRLSAAWVARLAALGVGGRADACPLAPLQAGLVFETLRASEPGTYSNDVVWRVRMDLDPERWRRAWQAAVDHHDVLRTAFAWEGLPEPQQRVAAVGTALPWELLDWRGAPVADRLEALRRRARSFDLRVAPLMRCALIRDDEGWLHVWSHHHAILDGWSVGRLLGDILASYEGRPLSPALPYREFVSWLATRDEAAAAHFWRDRLAGFPSPMEVDLPTTNAAVDRCVVRLPPAATTRLRERARRERLTLSTAVQGAWALTLARHTGRDDVVFGVTVAGRPAELPRVEERLGLFINTIPRRVRMDPGARVDRWLAELQAAAVEEGPFEHAPLTRHAGLFDTLLVFENYPFAGVQALELVAASEHPHYALTLVVVPGESLEVRLLCASPRSNPHPIAAELLRVLTALADAEPGTFLGDLAPTPVAAVDTTAPEGPGLLERFVAQAARSPDAVAIRCGENVVTYAALEARVQTLAASLQQAGVGPESAVGVCLERSPELVATLLAVLWAGGAYVPLDPAWPADRLAWMVADSRAVVVVSGDGLVPAPPIDRVATHPDQLAYILYTSGSTGRPKGVQISHRSLAALLAALGPPLGVGPEDTFAAVTSIGFDIAGLELFLPLVHGAEVLLVPTEVASDGNALGALLQGATFCQATPSTWQLLLAAGWRGHDRLQILCGGEALVPALAAALIPCGAALWNLYGPTEATIWATAARLRAGADVTIGGPLANVDCHVLDPSMRPVPVGSRGELYLGGLGLARGYQGRPGLTAERFVPHPWRPGARLYQTGDGARWRDDGTIEVLGRRDAQLKIRGFRIEPGEIESAMLETGLVQEAAVDARPAGPDDPRLVAWVVPAPTFDPAALLARLRQRLPAYMVPSIVEVLAALPRTPNGKLDRRALPAVSARPASGATTGTESVIAAVWRDVLGREVGPTDDFFALGGHSLLALRAMGQLSTRLRTELPVRLIFQAPTVERLAAAIAAGPSPWIVVERPHPGPRVLCFAYAGGTAALFRGWADALPGVELVAVERPAVADLSTLLDRLLAVVRPLLDRPYAIFGHSLGALVGYELAVRLQQEGHPPARLFAAGQRAPSLVASFGEPDEAGIPPEVVPRLRADLRLFDGYVASAEALACPITVVSGREDPDTSAPGAWAGHTTARVDLHSVPGDHFFVHDKAWLTVLQAELNRTFAPGDP